MLNSRIHDMAKELGKTCIYNFAFAQRSGAMKAPVGLLSDRTVLRSKMEGPRPDKFAFVEQCETMKAPGQEHARPFGGALCPGAFLFVVRRFTPSAAEPDSPAGGWSCSLS